MSANQLSPTLAWANVRSLPGEVWKRIWIAAAVYVVLSAAFSFYFVGQLPGTMLEQMQQMQNMQEQFEFPDGMISGLFLLNLVLLLTIYITNRVVAAHDRQEAPTVSFLLGGFLGRLLLPLIIAYLVLVLGAILVALVWGAFTGLLSVILPQQIAVVLAVIPFFILPFAGLYAVIRLTCLISVIAFEDLSLYAAIKRTWALTSGKFWPLFGIVLVVIGVALAALLIMALLEALTDNIFSQGNTAAVARLVFQLIIGPISAVIYFLLPVAIYRVLRDGENAEAAQA